MNESFVKFVTVVTVILQTVEWDVKVKGQISALHYIYITFSHLADAFIQSDLQMRTLEAIKTNKRATTCKCYDKSWLATVHVESVFKENE